MTVSQVDRTTNSVTINVSGITNGDRQTYIWITGEMLNSDEGAWYKLSDAKSYGYIDDLYVSSYETNNGDITIVVSDEYLELGYKVVDLKVTNVNTSSVDSWIIINTALDFEYDGRSTKHAGDEIDITVKDMRELNLFGYYFDYWLGEGDGTYYTLDGVSAGDKIYAKYLRQAAQNILNAVFYADYINDSKDVSVDVNLPVVYDYLYDITDYCLSGSDFKAEWFNNIAKGIRAFNETITI